MFKSWMNTSDPTSADVIVKRKPRNADMSEHDLMSGQARHADMSRRGLMLDLMSADVRAS